MWKGTHSSRSELKLVIRWYISARIIFPLRDPLRLNYLLNLRRQSLGGRMKNQVLGRSKAWYFSFAPSASVRILTRFLFCLKQWWLVALPPAHPIDSYWMMGQCLAPTPSVNFATLKVQTCNLSSWEFISSTGTTYLESFIWNKSVHISFLGKHFIFLMARKQKF